MTIALTAGNDVVDTYIRQEYDINGLSQESPPGTFLNLIGQTVDGGEGVDTVTVDWSPAENLQFGYFTITADSIGTVTMTTASGASHFTNFEKFEFKPHSGGASIVVNLGTQTADTIMGTDVGDSFLFGLAGNDTIVGGAGADRIIGGLNKDMLTGGSEADTFAFEKGDSGKKIGKADVITDFKHLSDKIDLSAIDANAKTAAVNDAFKFIKTGAFTHKAGQLHFIKDMAHKMTIIEADWNGDAAADFSIKLMGAMKLTAADFIL